MIFERTTLVHGIPKTEVQTLTQIYDDLMALEFDLYAQGISADPEYWIEHLLSDWRVMKLPNNVPTVEEAKKLMTILDRYIDFGTDISPEIAKWLNNLQAPKGE